MKYFEIELNGRTIRFRLRSSDAVQIEKEYKQPLLDYIQDYSITTITTLLRYLRRSDEPSFSHGQAMDLFDELIDNGYFLEKIVFDIIFEALVISGILSKTDLDEIKAEANKPKEVEVKNA